MDTKYWKEELILPTGIGDWYWQREYVIDTDYLNGDWYWLLELGIYTVYWKECYVQTTEIEDLYCLVELGIEIV